MRDGPSPTHPRCTAIVTGGYRCARAPIVRDFCTAIYPDGPAIRLCSTHARHWHAVCLAVARLHPAPPPNALATYERTADAWRWASDCAGS